MVDGRGFKVSFTRRTKANRWRRGGGGGGGLKLSVLIEAYLQPCISDHLIRTCLGEDDCQKQQKCHECSELTVSIAAPMRGGGRGGKIPGPGPQWGPGLLSHALY